MINNDIISVPKIILSDTLPLIPSSTRRNEASKKYKAQLNRDFYCMPKKPCPNLFSYYIKWAKTFGPNIILDLFKIPK